MKLDRQRPFGIFFSGNRSFIGQDGRLFDRQTEEEVTLDGTPLPADTGSSGDPGDAPQPQGGVDSTKVSCNQCGKEFTLPADPTARKLALGKLRAHLKKEHGIELEDKAS